MNYAFEGKFKKARKEFKKTLELESSYRLAEKNLKVLDDVIAEKLDDKSAVIFFRAVSYTRAGSQRG